MTTFSMPIDGESKRDSQGRFVRGTRPGPGAPPRNANRIDRMYLAGAIRRMLEEELDEESGLPKLLVLIHTAYEKAKAGDSDAMKLLFERGYGKTPPAYQQDPRILLEQICIQSGMTIEELASDPIAAELFRLLDEDRGRQALVAPASGDDQSRAGSELSKSILEPA